MEKRDRLDELLRRDGNGRRRWDVGNVLSNFCQGRQNAQLASRSKVDINGHLAVEDFVDIGQVKQLRIKSRTKGGEYSHMSQGKVSAAKQCIVN